MMKLRFGDRSLLETLSATAETERRYAGSLNEFWGCVDRSGEPTTELKYVDESRCAFADYAFLDGRSHSVGDNLKAALESRSDIFAREGALRLPRFSRALKGGRMTPTQTRAPCPEEWCFAVAAALGASGRGEMGRLSPLQFSSLLRPSECHRLHAVDAVPPAAAAEPETRCAVLLLAPSKGGPQRPAS